MRSLVAWKRHVLALTAGVLLFSFSPFARGATFVVTKTADTNDGACDADCSLREAIVAANANAGPDVITLPAGTYTLTIAGAGEDGGATGDLDIVGDLTINGAGSATTIVDGGGIDRVFHIVSAFTVVFNDLTIQGGVANLADGGGLLNEGTATLNHCVIGGNSAPSGDGGGLYNDDVMTISDCTIAENSASSGDGGGVYDNGVSITITNTWIAANAATNGNGGGIYINGIQLTMTGSTVSGNASDDGAGVYMNGNNLTMTNCTISGNTGSGNGDGAGLFHIGSIAVVTDTTIANNTAANLGGGIENLGTSLTLTNTIVANNSAPGSANCDGTVTDGGTNLQFPGTTCGATIPSADPLLSPLADNGGPTQTMAIGPGSPAIDAGTTGCPPTPAADQRGVARPQGAGCDIGAYELLAGGPTPTPTITVPPTITPTVTQTPLPGAPTATPTPRPAGQPAAVPTLSWPVLALFGMLLLVAAVFFLKGQP